MQTCFLFAENLDAEQCLSLRLDESGNLSAPLEKRVVGAFHVLQKDAQTRVVLPTSICSLYSLALPKLADSKARAVIPYALEEQLAEPVTLLHFAFMPHPTMPDHVLVAVLNKQYMRDLLHRLSVLEIMYDDITLDWFALAEGEACLMSDSFLVNHNTFRGAVGKEVMAHTLKVLQPATTVFIFNDNAPLNNVDKVIPVVEPSAVWIAARLFQHNYLNLCQGEFAHDTKQRMTKRWFMWAGALVGAWFVLGLVLKVILLLTLQHQIKGVDQQIATVYREFFPDAKTVVSPRFRIEQRLKQSQSGTDAMLWRLLEKLPTAIFPQGIAKADNTIRIQSIRYQAGSLIVNLACKDFKSLEAFETRLHHQGVTVRQLAASQKNKQVMATLELK